MINLVELLDEEQHPSPCRFGNIVDGHACYCHHDNGPRKCPIWRNFGEHDLSKWCKGDWDADDWDGGCPFFRPNIEGAHGVAVDAS
mgnify:CR=1 FL=1